jgi:hypothetical protein
MIRLVEGRPAAQGCGYQPSFEVVVVDGRLVSRAGSGRLAELADRLGLSRALGQFAGRRWPGTPPQASQGTV